MDIRDVTQQPWANKDGEVYKALLREGTSFIDWRYDLEEAFEQQVGLRNKLEITPENAGFNSIKMLPGYMTVNTGLYAAHIERFIMYDLGSAFALSLDKYLELPVSLVNIMIDVYAREKVINAIAKRGLKL